MPLDFMRIANFKRSEDKFVKVGSMFVSNSDFYSIIILTGYDFESFEKVGSNRWGCRLFTFTCVTQQYKPRIHSLPHPEGLDLTNNLWVKTIPFHSALAIHLSPFYVQTNTLYPCERYSISRPMSSEGGDDTTKPRRHWAVPMYVPSPLRLEPGNGRPP
jgi:hypothetical protein